MSTESPTLELVVIPELEKALVATSLAPDGVQTLRSAFTPHFVKFQELAVSAAGVPASAPKAARAMRLELKAIRIAADKTRKELKEDSLRRGRAIDGINALLEYQLVPIEEAMEKIEKAAEIAENNRIIALKATREAELTPFADPSFYDLGRMPDAQWAQLLVGAKAAHEAKIEAERKAEADRIAKEKVEAEERERQRQENERLKREAAEKEAALADERARVAKEQAEAAAAAKAELDRREALAAEERKKAEEAAAEIRRVAAENAAKAEEEARKEREAIEEKAAAEREKARKAQALVRAKLKKAEDELAAKKAAQAKKEAEERAAARRAAAAPDKEKLHGYSETLAYLSLPVMATDEGMSLANEIASRRDELAQWIKVQVAKL